jgi:hypothetical protein
VIIWAVESEASASGKAKANERNLFVGSSSSLLSGISDTGCHRCRFEISSQIGGFAQEVKPT